MKFLLKVQAIINNDPFYNSVHNVFVVKCLCAYLFKVFLWIFCHQQKTNISNAFWMYVFHFHTCWCILCVHEAWKFIVMVFFIPLNVCAWWMGDEVLFLWFKCFLCLQWFKMKCFLLKVWVKLMKNLVM